MPIKFDAPRNAWQVNCEVDLCPSEFRCSSSFVHNDKAYVKLALLSMGWEIDKTDDGVKFYCRHHHQESTYF